jgi:hypothetical protein
MNVLGESPLARHLYNVTFDRRPLHCGVKIACTSIKTDEFSGFTVTPGTFPENEIRHTWQEQR